MKAFGKNINIQLRGEKKTFGRNKKTFIDLVSSFDKLCQRTYDIEEKTGIILERYEEPFFVLIESLFFLNYEDWEAELVMWFVYDRVDAEGNLNALQLQDETSGEEEEITVETPEELYQAIKKIKKWMKK